MGLDEIEKRIEGLKLEVTIVRLLQECREAGIESVLRRLDLKLLNAKTQLVLEKYPPLDKLDPVPGVH